VEFRILGPLEVWADGKEVELGRGRQRALLVILVLHTGEVVSTDRLIDALWSGTPPPTAAKVLQNLVSQLRRALGAEHGAVVTRAPGYALVVPAEDVDARRFERLAAEGRDALESDAAAAREMLGQALALWRGEPLAEFAYEEFARAEVARLEELGLAALEDRIDADLALGRSAELVPELETLVGRHPLRERLRAQQMLALYRAGRQADALATYRSGQAALRDELGLEPSPSLRQLEQAILVQDPALGEPAPLPTPPTRRRRRPGLVAAAAAAIAGLAAILAFVLHDDAGRPVTVLPESIVKIDAASNRIVDSIEVGPEPGQVRVVDGDVFVSSVRDKTLSRIDADTGEVLTSGEHAVGPGIAAAGGQLWVGSESRAELTRVNPDSLTAIERIALDRFPGELLHALPALGAGSLWVSEHAPPAVSRYSLRTHRLIRRYELGLYDFPTDVAVGAGAAWIGLYLSGELLRIDAATGATRRIDVGPSANGPAVGFGSVWIASGEDGTVWRLNALTEKVESVIDVGDGMFELAVGAGSVWVGDYCGGAVARIDPETNEVVARIETGFVPRWLAVGGDHVWVGVSAVDTFELPGCMPTSRR
jgi:DNA-binding SARP family transcriptional activator/outer membrane protein assembly factor BamB